MALVEIKKNQQNPLKRNVAEQRRMGTMLRLLLLRNQKHQERKARRLSMETMVKLPTKRQSRLLKVQERPRKE